MPEYPWYEIVDGNKSLAQGDFFDSCPIVVPSTPLESDSSIPAEVIEYDIIIMSQSCDLEHKKLDLVLVCPVWPFSEFQARNDFYKSTEGKKALKQGYAPGYHLLNTCNIERFEKNYLVVDFRNVYGVPFNFLKDLATTNGERLRLLPPYREHLSQAFARFFMRVGLPLDIPSLD